MCWQAHRKTKRKNDTRWSSAYQILLRCLQLPERVIGLAEANVDALLPSSTAERRGDLLIKMVKDLHEVTKTSQWPNANFRISR